MAIERRVERAIFWLAVGLTVLFLLLTATSRAHAGTEQSVLSRVDLSIAAEKDGKPYLLEVGPGRQVYWEPAFPLPDGFIIHGIVLPKYDFPSAKKEIVYEEVVVELDGVRQACWLKKAAPFEFVIDTTGMSAGGAKAGLTHDIVATIKMDRHTRVKAAVSFKIGLPLPSAPPVVAAAPATAAKTDAPVPTVSSEATDKMAELEGKLLANASAIEAMSRKIAELEAAKAAEPPKPAEYQLEGQFTAGGGRSVSADGQYILEGSIVPYGPAEIVVPEPKVETPKVAVPTAPTPTILDIDWRGSQGALCLLRLDISAQKQTRFGKFVIKPGRRYYSLGVIDGDATVQLTIGSTKISGKSTTSCRTIKWTLVPKGGGR